jgi:hypothetical protein
MNQTYPANWPACVFCGKPVLDGHHLTCGESTCPESTARALNSVKIMRQALAKNFPESKD